METPVNRTQCYRLMGEAYGNWFWARKGKFNAHLGQEYRVQQIEAYRHYRALLPHMPPEMKANGATIYRDYDAVQFLGHGKKGEARYFYDSKLTREAGWLQYDTSQDAWYFGVWYNMGLRQTVTYAEGDLSVVVCPTDEIWKSELKDMADFYGAPPPAIISYDLNAGTRTEFFDPDARPDIS